MTATAIRALSAVVTQKSISELQSIDPTIFGPLKGVAEFIVDYYQEHHDVPSKNTVEEKFGESFIQEGNDDAIKYYFSEVRNDFIRRNMRHMLQVTSENVDDAPVDQLMSSLSSKIEKLSQFSDAPKDVSITNPEYAVDAVMQDNLDRINGKAGIMTGIPGIDESLPNGIGEGHLVVCFGYSGRGKTYLAQKIVTNAYEQGKKILSFSLEMSEQDQRKRLYTILSNGGFNLGDFAGTDISRSEMEDFASTKLDSSGDIIVTAHEKDGHLKPMNIKQKISKYDPDLVLIDYVQLMSDNAGSEGMTDRMRNVIKELRLLATSTGVPIILISSVTDKDGSGGRKKAPTIDQISWSRQIEYDATMVMAIDYEEDVYEDGSGIMDIICEKNRFGPRFAVKLRVDFYRGTFEPDLDPFGDTVETV